MQFNGTAILTAISAFRFTNSPSSARKSTEDFVDIICIFLYNDVTITNTEIVSALFNKCQFYFFQQKFS